MLLFVKTSAYFLLSVTQLTADRVLEVGQGFNLVWPEGGVLNGLLGELYCLR